MCFTFESETQQKKIKALKKTKMKKFILLFSVIFFAIFTKAQNVAINNDGTAAATSAMLDVKSTTKGMMMPRLTTAQRGAVASPAIGLLVFDTDTKTIWAYDGSSWKNLYTSGGGLTLPFSQTVNTATSALQVTNQGIGAGIEGASTAEFGTGLTAKATGNASWGLYAFTNGAGSKSVNAYAHNGTALYGENNVVSTNTLMSLLNFGTAKTATYQLSNNSSTDANVQIAGNNLGHQLKIYQTNAANAQAAVSIENSGTGTGLAATSNTGDGIVGISSTDYGVKGVTNTATGFAGVYGQNTGTAGSGVVGTSNGANTQGVYGLSTNGIAVRALSTSGTALDVSGNVKIAGGNTTPGLGKVLTSDASGNATWQSPNSGPTIGFKAKGLAAGFAELGQNVNVKVHFAAQEYDLSNNFIDINENGNLTEASVFYPPVNGLYHFDLNVRFGIKAAPVGHYDYDFVIASIFIIRSGNTIEVSRFLNSNPEISGEVTGSTDVVLNAGDQVYLTARQGNFTGVSMPLIGDFFGVVFSGHLVKKL